jgi:hypothetical protein
MTFLTTIKQNNRTPQQVVADFKPLPALNYRRIISTSNEHFTYRAPVWWQTGIVGALTTINARYCYALYRDELFQLLIDKIN